MLKRVLAVDDDDMNLMRIKKILRTEYDVCFAPDTPVIFLTASGQEDDVVSAIRLGAVNYLKKPFPPQELILRISQVLEKR